MIVWKCVVYWLIHTVKILGHFNPSLVMVASVAASNVCHLNFDLCPCVECRGRGS